MATLTRMKRVTDPLDDKVKARIYGHRHHSSSSANLYESSGSEHEADSCLDLDGLFFFFSDMDGDEDHNDDRSSDAYEGEEDGSSHLLPPPAVAVIRDLMASDDTDRWKSDLVRDVSRAVARLEAAQAAVAATYNSDKSSFKRAVMGYLRDAGYNAGLCKSRWEGGKGLTPGTYEYIDVVAADRINSKGRKKKDEAPQKRYIVDLDFGGEFEIARATAEYSALMDELPRVYVGGPEELKRAVRVMAGAAKRSLKSRDMHVPPWRKTKYMLCKWLGPHRRTTNMVGEASAAASADTTPVGLSFRPGKEIPCRTVGFETAAAVNRVVFSMART